MYKITFIETLVWLLLFFALAGIGRGLSALVSSRSRSYVAAHPIMHAAWFFLSICIIVVLVEPFIHPRVQDRGRQTKALSQAKQIGLTCKLYAWDHDGEYPYYSNPKERTGPARDSNDVFQLLIPDYSESEKNFYVKGSAWSYKIPDLNGKLEQGENHWAYFAGLKNTSDPSYPLIADGFVENSQRNPAYTKKEELKGGKWKGKKAIIIRADQSGAIENLPNPDLFKSAKENGSIILNPR